MRYGHAEGMKSIIGAVSLLGVNRVKELLPKPFVLDYSNHSTGCQIRITMEAEGVKSVDAWVGSIWNDSMYEFNDRDKRLGMQTECMFAAPHLERFFEALADAVVQHATGSAKTAMEHQAAQALDHRDVLDSYRKMLESTNAQR